VQFPHLNYVQVYLWRYHTNYLLRRT